MRQKRILIGAVVIMLLISISVITVVVFQNRQGNVVGTSETITTSEMAVSETIVPETKNTGMTESVKESVTESETKAIISAPEELEHLLAENGNTAEQIAAIGCRQLITVESSGSNALISFYRLSDNEWIKDERLSCSGYVGANSVTEDMHEGGYATPKGIYSISDAFYIYEAPVTGLSSFQITNDSYWVDDPNSVYYNQHIEGLENKDWESAEHMIDYTTAYEYGCVIDYNTDAVYNAGSAIFFHVSYSPTAGCVGTDKTMMLEYLSVLDKSENPYIAIV